MAETGKKKKRNPLRRRLPRELKDELGKYLVIFLLMTATIGLCSGFLVADNSMIVAYEESFEKYNIEDGNFRSEKALNKAQRADVEDLGIRIYENYYAEEEMANGSLLRLFGPREEIDGVCLMEGSLPQKSGEIAIDRMYADNNGLSVGDSLSVKESEEGEWTITGLVALSDYSSLFENNNDAMFDATLFGVAVVSAEEFDSYPTSRLFFNYAWKYDASPTDEAQEKEWGDRLLENLNSTISLKSFVPRYLNQAITFTGEDMGSDKAMIIVLLYIMIIIMAFVFAVTIANTIADEANVIGTLRAMGYSRGELVRHYMTLPLLITLIGAIVGNLMGYTFMKEIVAKVYYGSYSLPTYVTIWNAEAFWETTLVPIALMAVITWVYLSRVLRLSPQQFLRRDLSRSKKKNAFPLPKWLAFFRRFRIRVIFQNLPGYLVLALGILFANLLLLFGLGFPAVLDDFEQNITSDMFCRYQYILDIPASMTSADTKLESLISTLKFMSAVETENPDAEKFMAYSLRTNEKDEYKVESVTLYGVEADSRYIDLPLDGDQVFVSSALADKYYKKVGDTICLKEEYEDKEYTFIISGIYSYDGAVAVFMTREYLNQILDYDKDMFAGYLSDSEITDIDEEYIGSVIDEEAMTKISRQLDRSMGGMMSFVDAFSVLIFLVLMYLLSKIIIEKNAQSISMAKILGYSNSEINRLYILPTSLVVILCLIVSLPIEKAAVIAIFHWMMLEEMTGWLPLTVNAGIMIEMFLMGLGAYAAVALLEIGRIRKVPMDMALKNVE